MVQLLSMGKPQTAQIGGLDSAFTGVIALTCDERFLRRLRQVGRALAVLLLFFVSSGIVISPVSACGRFHPPARKSATEAGISALEEQIFHLALDHHREAVAGPAVP